ncbi:hypothetical protein [Nonomuraea deserti]|nr:hypothetical protein [Nonomuraea deserti]
MTGSLTAGTPAVVAHGETGSEAEKPAITWQECRNTLTRTCAGWA